jgi:hypothetical protein
VYADVPYRTNVHQHSALATLPLHQHLALATLHQHLALATPPLHQHSVVATLHLHQHSAVATLPLHQRSALATLPLRQHSSAVTLPRAGSSSASTILTLSTGLKIKQALCKELCLEAHHQHNTYGSRRQRPAAAQRPVEYTRALHARVYFFSSMPSLEGLEEWRNMHAYMHDSINTIP